MASETQVDQADQAGLRDEVRRTLDQLNQLANSADSVDSANSQQAFDEFCNTVLAEVVRITDAHGAVLWQVSGNSPPRLTHQSETIDHPVASKLVDEENLQHTGAVVEVLSKGQPLSFSSESFNRAGDDSHPGNNGPFLLLLAPIFDRSKKCRGALELVQRGNIEPPAQAGYLRFLTQIAQLFHRWFEQQELAVLTQSKTLSHEKLEYVSQVHRSIDPTQTDYAIANEARRLLKCDRVSVARWNGRRCKVTAISSQDRFDNRANVVRKLGYVATSSVSADMPLWITGNTDGIAPRVANQINGYLDEAHSRTLVVLPIATRPPESNQLTGKRRPPKSRKLGALVIEYFDADVKEAEISQPCDLIIQEAETAMENSRVYGEVFLLPIWKRMGWLQKFLFRDHLAKTMTGLMGLAILTAFLFLFPKELKMKVDGVMHPTQRRTIFSQTEGIIRTVAIDERSEVKRDDLLLRLENPDLELQMTDAELRLETIQHQINDATFKLSDSRGDPDEKVEIGSSLELLRKRQTNLKGQLELMKKKQSFQTIVSPIDGVVVTPQPKRRLTNFPATPNLAVLEIADLAGPWELELSIPQNKLGYITQALQDNDDQPLEVEFRISTNPNLVLRGHLVSVANRAVTSTDGATEFRAMVEADGDQFQKLESELRIGTGVTAKVHCGTRKLGFVCFYQIYDWLRTRVFF